MGTDYRLYHEEVFTERYIFYHVDITFGLPLRLHGICSVSKPKISFNLGMKNESRKKYETGLNRDTAEGVKTDQWAKSINH